MEMPQMVMFRVMASKVEHAIAALKKEARVTDIEEVPFMSHSHTVMVLLVKLNYKREYWTRRWLGLIKEDLPGFVSGKHFFYRKHK
jgi:hypothetical protein